MHHFIRTGGFRDIHQGGQRNHLVLVISSIKLPDRFGLNSVAGLRLDVHLIGSIQEIKIVDVGRTEIGLQSTEDRIDRNIQGFDLSPIDIQVNLGDLRSETGEQSNQPVTGPCFGDQLIGSRL